MASVDIAAKTKKLEVDQRLPLKYYYRSADNVLRQADVYRRERNQIELYVLLLRFASLIMETIPEHREYKMGAFRNEREDFRRRLLDVLDEVEKLKPTVKELNTKIVPNLGFAPLQDGAFPAYSMGDNADYSFFQPSSVFDSMASSGNGTFDLLTGPMDLLSGPILPRKPDPPSIRGLTDTFSSMNFSIPTPKSETLSRHSFLGPINNQTKRTVQSRVSYPTSLIDDGPISMPAFEPDRAVPSPAVSSAEPILWPEAEEVKVVVEGPPPPSLSPSLDNVKPISPDIAPEVRLIRQPSPPPIEAPVFSLPSLPSQLHPNDVADPRPGPPAIVEETIETTKGPKPLHISAKMMEEFMRLVKDNTSRNLETCGVLAGTLKKGTFYITTLLLPKQQATSDSCQTVNEEEIFEAQDKRGLFQLGWIHTHPSQSCFMSSIDLHTHYSYQVMLQEAIAVVMAPSDSSRRYGIFRLSEPEGVKIIQNCHLRGFHPHETPRGGGALYEHSAHVFLNPNLKFDIMDLR